MSYETPILFLLFNRPVATARAFAQIRELRPRKLYLAADGPRADRPHDHELCAAARDAVSDVDWDCEVKRLFRKRNLGCGTAVSTAITWFFQHVEQGIILEDDLQPDPSFFEFCAAMLERHRDNPRIMHVGGNNFQLDSDESSRRSFYYSRYNHIWGWGTWRRAWAHYDFTMAQFPRFARRQAINAILAHPPAREYWLRMFSLMHQGKIDTWDYQWTFAVWNQDGLAVLPAKNLVVNRGFDGEATHTTQGSRLDQMPLEHLPGPYMTPAGPPEPDAAADAFSYEFIFTGRVNHPQEILQSIAAAAQSGNQGLATDLARRFVRLYADHPEMLYATALLLMQSGEHAQAVPHLIAYLRLRPEDPNGRALLENARANLGAYHKAE